MGIVGTVPFPRRAGMSGAGKSMGRGGEVSRDLSVRSFAIVVGGAEPTFSTSDFIPGSSS